MSAREIATAGPIGKPHELKTALAGSSIDRYYSSLWRERVGVSAFGRIGGDDEGRETTKGQVKYRAESMVSTTLLLYVV